MNRNDYSAEAAENYEQKCLCVLVLDLSGSMREVINQENTQETGETVYVDNTLCKVVYGGTCKLDKLREGLDNFYSEIESDTTTSQRLEIAILGFNDQVQTLQEPALISNVVMPELEADGNTCLVDAVNEAIDVVEARKSWYKNTNQPYYRPWIILMTDGRPDDDQDINTLAAKIKRDTAAKRYEFLPIGVDNANMEVLQSIQGNIPAMKLQGTKFSSFFKWLSASMSTVVNAQEGQKVDLKDGSEDWMESFTI